MMKQLIPGAPSAWLPYVLVDDIKVATKKAKSLGATVMRDVTEVMVMRLVKHHYRSNRCGTRTLAAEEDVRNGRRRTGKPACRAYRYPNMGWWLIHLAAVSLVYYLGNRFWS